MGKIYVAAFLLPTPTTKRLTDAGWEFESSVRLPEGVIAVLKEEFYVHHTDTYLGMEVFEEEKVKFTIIRDSLGEIEHIAVQLRGVNPEELSSKLAAARLRNIEVFVPSSSAV